MKLQWNIEHCILYTMYGGNESFLASWLEINLRFSNPT